MQYIITGTSSGIGQALVQYFLQRGDTVVGISRRNNIKHKQFKFIACDLSKIHQLQSIRLNEYVSAEEKICLINNAGVIGTIDRTQNLTIEHYLNVGTVNFIAVQCLITKTIQEFGFDNIESIVNISSGAAQRPIPSWAAYCASKAGLDMFALTLQQEINELGKTTKVYNISPGVVDTKMQTEIRNSDAQSFSSHDKFIELKKNDELKTPTQVAEDLALFLSKNHEENQVIYRL